MDSLLKPSEHEIHDPLLKKYISYAITSVLNGSYSKAFQDDILTHNAFLDFQAHFSFFELPHGLTKTDLKQRLLRYKFWVAEKTNGLRYMLFMGQWPLSIQTYIAKAKPLKLSKLVGPMFINPFFSVMVDRKGHVFQLEIQAPENIFKAGCLLDGELVWNFDRRATGDNAIAFGINADEGDDALASSDNVGGENVCLRRSPKYLAFDHRDDNIHANYEHRHTRATEIIKQCKSADLILRSKPIYPPQDLKAKELKQILSKLSHASDGLIFTPDFGNLPILKWKQDHTIELTWKYNAQTKTSCFFWSNNQIDVKHKKAHQSAIKNGLQLEPIGVFELCSKEEVHHSARTKIQSIDLVFQPNTIVTDLVQKFEKETDIVKYLNETGLVVECKMFPPMHANNTNAINSNSSLKLYVPANANAISSLKISAPANAISNLKLSAPANAISSLKLPFEILLIRKDKQFPNTKHTIVHSVQLCLENIDIFDFFR